MARKKAEPETDPAKVIGATSEELASHPGLLTDLALALVPKRVLNCRALIALLGGSTHWKVKSRLDALSMAQAQLAAVTSSHHIGEMFAFAKRVLEATAKLEESLFTLVTSRAKRMLKAEPEALEFS